MLLLAPTSEQRRTCPTNPNRVNWSLDPSGLQFIVNDELGERIGAETPRCRPVRDDVASFGQFGTAWVGVYLEDCGQCHTSRMVRAGQVEIHAPSLRRGRTTMEGKL